MHEKKNALFMIALALTLVAFFFILTQGLLRDTQDAPLVASLTDSVVITGHPEQAPFMFRDGNVIRGIGPDLVRTILNALNIESTSPYVGSWSDVHDLARNGDVDVIVAAYRTAEREEYLVYTDAFTVDTVSVFVRADDGRTFAAWEDLVGRNGTGTLGDSYGQAFDDFIATRLDFAYATNVAEAFDALEAGDTDYVVYARYAGDREVAAQGRAGRVMRLEHPLVETDFHVAIARVSPLADRAEDFNRLIAQYKTDGTIDALFAAYAGEERGE